MRSRALTPAEENAPYWNREGCSVCFGCLQCRDIDVCGGLRADKAAMNCIDYCRCMDPKRCDIPCSRNPRILAARYHEVGGWEFGDVPRAQMVKVPKLPSAAPIIYQRNRRLDNLESKAVAVCLHMLFSKRTGKAKFSSKEELAERLKFDPRSALIIVGVGKDPGIEAYWEKARANGFPECLRALKPALVTAPNYSLFSNLVRWSDLHSMKRIALCWQEMAAAGLPASLHLNARTPRDYERWTEFIRDREEVQSVAFEFGTGARIPARSPWHVAHLCSLGEQTKRRLILAVKGGEKFIPILAPHFKQIVLLDSYPFMKSVSRRVLEYKDGKAQWVPTMTLENQCIDSILQHNVDARAKP